MVAMYVSTLIFICSILVSFPPLQTATAMYGVPPDSTVGIGVVQACNGNLPSPPAVNIPGNIWVIRCNDLEQSIPYGQGQTCPQLNTITNLVTGNPMQICAPLDPVTGNASRNANWVMTGSPYCVLLDNQTIQIDAPWGHDVVVDVYQKVITTQQGGNPQFSMRDDGVTLGLENDPLWPLL